LLLDNNNRLKMLRRSLLSRNPSKRLVAATTHMTKRKVLTNGLALCGGFALAMSIRKLNSAITECSTVCRSLQAQDLQGGAPEQQLLIILHSPSNPL